LKYTGDFQEYLPLLTLGEYIHAGRHTTFGFGKYELTYE